MVSNLLVLLNSNFKVGNLCFIEESYDVSIYLKWCTFWTVIIYLFSHVSTMYNRLLTGTQATNSQATGKVFLPVA